ncbi:ribonuclease H-like domain-containing protein [Rhizophagus irregularis DAOM 181602=DAOM 197198]|nr:ribonuclease H-like domain-containing protein [Rhizophagus irregularis DAOM 181602=DAOM 197198]
MSFYKTIEELDDKGIKEELRIWHYMYTIECPICNKMTLKKEAVKYDKEFTGEICKSCSEKEKNDVSEAELRAKKIQKVCEGVEVGDSDIENSDTESEENILLNMATEIQIKRLMENALGYPANTLDGVVGVGAHLIDRIENAGNEAGGIINIPLFYGKEEEDVSDWIRQFEVAFAAIGKAAGPDGGRQATFAAAHLRGAAAQWYHEMREANAGHLVNWADADNDNDLKHRIKRRFTREDVRRRKMLELRKTKQGINENVDDYTRRFRQVLRLATRGHALADEYQVDFYIEGLEATVGYQVRRQNPANLNDAINLARREEEARNELFRKAGNIPDRVYPEIGKGYVEEQNVGTNVRHNKPLNENYEDELAEKFEKMRIAKLEKQVQNMERELNNNGNRDQWNQRRNNRAPINYDEITCFRCNRRGHFATRCPLGNNIRRNERRVNLMDIEEYEEDYDYENEESDDDYDHENNEYNNSQLYNYDRDLYEKDNPVQERRRSNRINPKQGWKNFGKPNLDKEIEERGKEEYKYRNRREVPMEEDVGDEQPMYDRPIGPNNTNIPKRYKWSKKRGEYYDTMEGINRWKEAGGKRRPREDKIIGVKSKDPVDYENLLNIVEQQGRMIKKMIRKGDKIE